MIVHDGKTLRYYVLANPTENLRGWLPDALYAEALQALGETPVIDL